MRSLEAADASDSPAGTDPRRRWHHLKDPFPAWSHWAGVVFSLLGGVVLLASTAGRPLYLVAFGIYCASLVLLYVASALAHSVHCDPPLAERFDRLDYTAIFVVIAGTYTPFCLVTLRGTVGWWLFAAVWITAACGIAIVYFGNPTRHWPRVLTYVAMGWLGACAAPQLLRALPITAIAGLIGGGVVYSVGALVYLTKRPRLWPGVFGYHDLWHCMVLAASAIHFYVVLAYVADVPRA